VREASDRNYQESSQDPLHLTHQDFRFLKAKSQFILRMLLLPVLYNAQVVHNSSFLNNFVHGCRCQLRYLDCEMGHEVQKQHFCFCY
jgi:hypothetical protein